MTEYCLILDRRYVAYSYCLYKSIHRNIESASVKFYCMDESVPWILKKLGIPQKEIVKREEFIPPSVIKIENEYAHNEFCWRCKPLAVSHSLKHADSGEWVFYLDSDMFVFANIEECIELDNNWSVILTAHRFSKKFAKYREVSGQFNAGFVGFRNDQKGLEALKWWEQRCAESCSAIPTSDTYADQKYLEVMYHKFGYVGSIGHSGLNAAPWNIQNYNVTGSYNDIIKLNEDRLLLYHFQGMRFIYSNVCEVYSQELKMNMNVKNLIYEPYLIEIKESYNHLRGCLPGYKGNLPEGYHRGREIYKSVRQLIKGKSNLMYVFRGKI